MNHLTEEQLILHYYGEEGDPLAMEAHLEGCSDCRARYGAYQRVLNVVDSLPVPEVSAEYEAQLWRELAPKLSGLSAPSGTGHRSWWPVRLLSPAFSPWRWAAAGVALAGLLTVAFMAGRFYPRTRPGHREQTMLASADPQAGERVMLVAIGDYLERSQLVLIELANAHAKGPLDISSERERAQNLVSENRLYRQTAEHIGDTAVTNVLEELDRVLLEIAHSPSELSPEELGQLRQRFEAQGILFKIRVLGSNVRKQEGAGANRL
jgi:hypothetical protein